MRPRSEAEIPHMLQYMLQCLTGLWSRRGNPNAGGHDAFRPGSIDQNAGASRPAVTAASGYVVYEATTTEEAL